MRGRKRPVAAPAERRNVGYVRVSSDEQAQTGVSLEAQEARIRAYATALGRQLDDVVIDAGVSAKSLARPGMERVLAGVRDGTIGMVIALKLDRLTRSTRDLGDLLELFARSDAALVSVSESLDTQTAAGRMVVSMLGVVAQWEREAIAERTAFALAHKRRTRVAYGRTPFGFRREGDQLVEYPPAQAALALARALHEAGASYRQIAAALEADGVRTARGGAHWHAASVRDVLRSRIATEDEDCGPDGRGKQHG